MQNKQSTGNPFLLFLQIVSPTFIKYLVRRKWTLLSIALITPLGFYSKFYSGPAFEWVNNSLGGVLYVIFWSLAVSLLFLHVRPWRIALVVFLITCFLECLQLWHPSFLETIRSTFMGATLLGNSFSWSDLGHYVIGLLISGILLGRLLRYESLQDQK